MTRVMLNFIKTRIVSKIMLLIYFCNFSEIYYFMFIILEC